MTGALAHPYELPHQALAVCKFANLTFSFGTLSINFYTFFLHNCRHHIRFEILIICHLDQSPTGHAALPPDNTCFLLIFQMIFYDINVKQDYRQVLKC